MLALPLPMCASAPTLIGIRSTLTLVAVAMPKASVRATQTALSIMKILIAADGSDYTTRVLDHIATQGQWRSDEHSYTVVHSVLAIPNGAAAFVPPGVATRSYKDDAEKVFGRNALRVSTHVATWTQILRQFRDPLVYLLLVAIAIAIVAWLISRAYCTAAKMRGTCSKKSAPARVSLVLRVVQANNTTPSSSSSSMLRYSIIGSRPEAVSERIGKISLSDYAISGHESNNPAVHAQRRPRRSRCLR